MTGYAIGAGTVVAAGAFLRWAIRPVLIAFELGRLFERMQRLQRREATTGPRAGSPPGTSARPCCAPQPSSAQSHGSYLTVSSLRSEEAWSWHAGAARAAAPPSRRRARRPFRRCPEKTRQLSGKAPVIASAPWPQRSWRSTSRSDWAIERPPRPAVIEGFPRMNLAVLWPPWDQGEGDQVAGHPHRGQPPVQVEHVAAWCGRTSQ